MKITKKLFYGIAAATFACSLSIPTHAATTLTLSNWVPPAHWLPKDVLMSWMADVENATNGNVKVKMLPKALGAPNKHWELARKGTADVAWSNFTYEPERFKHVWFAELPGMGSNAEAQSIAMWRTFEKYLKDNKDFAGVKVLGVSLFGGGQLHHPKKLVVTPDDLKSQKVRMGGPIQKEILESMGAIPVAGPATKAYEMLEGGVIDASLHPMESVVNFRLDGLLKNHTVFPEGFYDAVFFIGMNQKKFDKLPKADQDAIMSVSGEKLSAFWGRVFDEQNKAKTEKMRADGHSFSEPSADLLKLTQDIRAKMLKDLQAEGSKYGIKDYGEMVKYYVDQYKSLTQ